MKAHANRGVTLVELVVVLGIIGILSTIVITSHATFNKTILLTNTAYDVALTIRSAETFGLGSRITKTAVANAGYGVHFDTSSPTSFILFADTDSSSACHATPAQEATAPTAIPGGCSYSSGETVQSYVLGNGVTIAKLYSYVNNASTEAQQLDVVFARPNTQTFFSRNGSYSAPITKACIALTSQQGSFSYIYIEQTGEVHVSSTACP